MIDVDTLTDRSLLAFRHGGWGTHIYRQQYDNMIIYLTSITVTRAQLDKSVKKQPNTTCQQLLKKYKTINNTTPCCSLPIMDDNSQKFNTKQ
jgi:hypothetical protein